MANKPSKIPRATVPPSNPVSNAEIANHLLSLAQLLSAQGENPFKVKAYRRAGESIKSLAESVDDLVRQEKDLTVYPGIGRAIAGAIKELVLTRALRSLESLRATVSPEIAALSEYPRLDSKLILRIYKRLAIGSIAELKEKLAGGELREKMGARIEHSIQRALKDAREILLYDAEEIVAQVRRYLLENCRAARAEVTGEFRRRVEVLSEISFLIETSDFPATVSELQRYGGKMELVQAEPARAVFRHSAGVLLEVKCAPADKWGLALLLATGAEGHLQKLEAVSPLGKHARSKEKLLTEAAVYRALGLSMIEPELREGKDEVERASRGRMPVLVSKKDLRGDLHAHTTSSDGAHSIEQMAEAARSRGYEYLGVTDHSQSLKIARGVAEEDLWKQIRLIDRLNEKSSGFRVFKSAEVDILVDGSLDYSTALLQELDYTICSIHSRFGLGKKEQTERLIRAMDHSQFNILGHATGRLLLRRPGYEIDIERLIAHAKAVGCFFEINASPDRLDLSAENARVAREAGVKIAICTDAHSKAELDFISCGLDQARRAMLQKTDVLNCLPPSQLIKLLKR